MIFVGPVDFCRTNLDENQHISIIIIMINVRYFIIFCNLVNRSFICTVHAHNALSVRRVIM